MLSDVLKRKSIYSYFSRTAMEKAVTYQAQGRVSNLKVSDDLKHVSAAVRGSGSNRYRVDIALAFSGDALTDLDGDCTCPMTYNCKHVAATLLEALSGKESPATHTHAAPSGPTAPPVLSSELTSWIDSVGRAARGDEAGADQSQCLLYCFKPSDHAMPRLNLSLRSVRALKGGGFAESYTSPILHEFKAVRAPKYFRDVDIDIVTQAAAGTRDYVEQGPYAEELLKRMVATGRAFWLDHKRTPLKWADAREDRIEWQSAGKPGLTLIQLRSEGYEILVDDDFPYRLADSSGDFDAALESSGIDWFELELGIDIDGERQDLAPHVAALVSAPGFTPDRLRQLADKGERFYLPLADGRQLALAADRFLPLVLALHGLHLSGSLDGSKKIRLSQAEIVPLLGVENERFVFRGADNLRRLANLLQLRGLAAPDLPPTFRATLRPYQAQGVAWLDLLRESGLGGVLADDMGLGKTIQVLALIALEKQRGRLTKPVLVVAPTSLMTNWSAEAEKFAPDLKVLVLQGPTRKEKFPAIAEHDLVLTTYPLIARDREVLLTREWHIAVLDEAQTVKNPDAATTRWLREVKAAHRFCLTGTPMENHLGELWSIMSFVMPGYLGDKPRSRANGAPRSRSAATRCVPRLWRSGPNPSCCVGPRPKLPRYCRPRARSWRPSCSKVRSAISTIRPGCRCRARFARPSQSEASPKVTSLCWKPCCECGRPVAIRRC